MVATIYGQASKVVIDTGSGLNLLSEDYYNKSIKNQGLKLVTDNLTNIRSANDEAMTNIGKVYIEVTSGTHSSSHWFEIVKNLSVDVLLGNEYLYKVGARINFRKEIIKIGNSIIGIDFKEKSYDMYLTKVLKIRPGETKEIVVTSKTPIATGLYEWYKSKKVLGVKIVKELISIPIVREKREIVMTVTNTYPRSIKLYKGSRITTLMPVQVTHLLQKDKSLDEQIKEIDFNKNCNLSQLRNKLSRICYTNTLKLWPRIQ